MDKKAELMQKVLLKRNICLILLISVSAIFNVIHARGMLDSLVQQGANGDFLRGFQIGMFIAIDLVCVYVLVKNLAILNDEKKLLELYIKEHDERNRHIQMLVGMNTYWIEVATLLLTTVIIGYFSMVAMLIMIGLTLLLAIERMILYVNYSNKF